MFGQVPGGHQPDVFSFADLNGDGRDDLVVADDGKKIATIYLSINN